MLRKLIRGEQGRKYAAFLAGALCVASAVLFLITNQTTLFSLCAALCLLSCSHIGGCVYYNHAMTFQGVELGDDGRPVAWRIENSWGEDACKKGYLVASAEWFRTYGGEVVVRREFVPAEVLDLWDNAPVEEVDPWTTIGMAMAPRL